MKVYLDNASTTKVDEKVLKVMLPYFSEKYGNASSQHMSGQEAKEAMDKARRTIAKEINAKTGEIIFTSGGTESNNQALKGLFFQHKDKDHIITTKIEHDSVMSTCKWLEKQGAKVTYLDVDKEGLINLEQLKNEITEKTLVVSIIHGNNEVGTIQDLTKIGEICKEKNVILHTDACQSFTKVPIDVKKQNISLMSLNSHKIHGPKGVGVLYIKDGTRLMPFMHGGGHERGQRSGTENVSGIVGFGEAVKVSSSKDVKKMIELREKLIEGLLEIPRAQINGSRKERLCNNVNVSFNDIEGEAIGGYLEREDIFVSTGSACMSHTLKSSHVLTAIGLGHLAANSSVRLSLSKYTTEKEIKYVLEKMQKVVSKLRLLSPLVD